MGIDDGVEPVGADADIALHLHGDPIAVQELADAMRAGHVRLDMSLGTSGHGVAVHVGKITIQQDDDRVAPVYRAPVHRMVIWLGSRMPNAQQILRMAVVSLDALPGNQVDGISALYLASGTNSPDEPDGPDTTVAVLQLSTRLTAPDLDRALATIALGHEHGVTMRIVQVDGEPRQNAEPIRTAAVLAPWLSMDPDARMGSDPISYRLAQAPDADRVGLLSDNWIIGDVS